DEKKGKTFVIRPSETIPIKRLERDPDKLQAMYDLGVNDAKTHIKELKHYLEN
ncbi:MAG: DUF6363 domain-containing protein, partial [Alkalibacterium sp.]